MSGRVARDGSTKAARGRRFAQLRSRTRLTQEQFAQAAGIPRTLVSKLENGVNAGTSYVTIRAYARATGLAVEIVGDYVEDGSGPFAWLGGAS